MLHTGNCSAVVNIEEIQPIRVCVFARICIWPEQVGLHNIGDSAWGRGGEGMEDGGRACYY